MKFQSAIPKFAVIGTSCAGKTTMVYEICAKLKRLGVYVDGLLQQDRRFNFDRHLLETQPEAQYVFIMNIIVTENELLLRQGTDLLVSDRSVIDFYAYYEYQYGRSTALFEMVKEYAKSYKKIIMLSPLAYEDNGSRPDDEFRNGVDACLRKILTDMSLDNLVTLSNSERDKAYPIILENIDRIMGPKEFEVLPKIFKEDCLVGGSYAFNRATKKSDVDIYLLSSTSDFVNYDTPEMLHFSHLCRETYGVYTQVRRVPKDVWDYVKDQGFKELKY